jgi:salicylate hydroxylase
VPANPGIFGRSDIAARKRQILIAGGGIAGLTAALALEQRGFAVTVFERSAERSNEGAGLQLSPNATRLLARLGVLPRLTASAVQVQSIDLLSGAARPLLSLDVSASSQRWGAPYLAVHRADLSAALMQAAMSRPAIIVRFGAEVTHFARHANGVTASLTTSHAIGEVEGIFLIGADGAWSKVGGELFNSPPKFTGYVAHRAMMDASAALPDPLRQLLDRRAVGAFLAPRAHLVAYPLRGGAALNLVLITRASAEPRRQALLPQGRLPPHAAAPFAPEMQSCLNEGGLWTQWPVYAQSHSANWADGKNVILIGDAAHAIAPFGAQGAAMAIEDGWTIAECLHAHRDSLSMAPAAFEKLRRARIRQVASRTALNGFAYHAQGLAAAARDAFFRLRGQKMLDGLDWIYAYDASAAAQQNTVQTLPGRR